MVGRMSQILVALKKMKNDRGFSPFFHFFRPYISLKIQCTLSKYTNLRKPRIIFYILESN